MPRRKPTAHLNLVEPVADDATERLYRRGLYQLTRWRNGERTAVLQAIEAVPAIMAVMLDAMERPSTARSTG